jgi:hypothetical protein
MNKRKSNNSSFNIINFDEICDDGKEKPKKKCFLMPDHPFRLLICGGSGSGKTNVLMNMITRFLDYDKIYIYTKHLDQDKYKWLQDFFHAIEEDPDLQDMADFPIAVYGTHIKDLIPVDKLDKEKRNLVIFDDMLLEKDQRPMTEFYIRARHKNCSVVYLSQSYFSTPKDIRANCSCFMIFDIPAQRQLNMILSDHCSEVDKDEFKNMFRQAVSKPFNFFLVDSGNKNKELKYRSGFDDVFVPDEF